MDKPLAIALESASILDKRSKPATYARRRGLSRPSQGKDGSYSVSKPLPGCLHQAIFACLSEMSGHVVPACPPQS